MSMSLLTTFKGMIEDWDNCEIINTNEDYSYIIFTRKKKTYELDWINSSPTSKEVSTKIILSYLPNGTSDDLSTPIKSVDICEVELGNTKSLDIIYNALKNHQL